ncbi:MAG: hypothetical protein PHF37_09955 [Phycisphaerae bacterium]|nr:hypothetical protein [Phycisphaerae bacterium]
MNNNQRIKMNGLNHLKHNKKVVFATALIAVMVVLWAKALTGKGPQKAKAGSVTRTETPAQEQIAKITYVVLPSQAGRNDTLTRDFFEPRWTGFVQEGHEADTVDTSLLSGDDKIARRLCDLLKLQAISRGRDNQPEAFINDSLLKVGDKLIVNDNGDKYECEVISIKEEQVQIDFEGTQISLKMIVDESKRN